MYILTSCHRCGREAMEAGHAPTAFHVELTDSGYVSAKCPNGHDVLASIQNFDFELLFDLAGMALLDGYSREAVITFAAAVERASEIYIRCNLHADYQADPLFEKSWAKIRSQSERQLGAFILLWLANEKTQARTFSNDETKLRNDCVHYGIIPSYERALAFGQSALEMIEEMHTALVKDGPEKLSREVFRRMMRGNSGAPLREGKSVGTQCLPTMIDPWKKDREPTKPLAERLPNLAKYRQWLWQPPSFQTS